MAKIDFNITPRRTGKTVNLIEKAIDLYKEKKPFLYFCMNHRNKNIVRQKFLDKIGLYVDNPHLWEVENSFITPEEFYNSPEKYLAGKNTKHFILDEYLYFTKKAQAFLYEYLNRDDYVIYISSSPPEQFDRKIFEFAKTIKKQNIYLYDFLTFTDFKAKEQFVYLYNNFLTDENTELFYWHDYYKKVLGEDYFNLEILGKIFKDEK